MEQNGNSLPLGVPGIYLRRNESQPGLVAKATSDATDGEEDVGVLIPSAHDSIITIYRTFEQTIKDGSHVIIITLIVLYMLSRQAVGKAWDNLWTLVKTTSETSISNAERLKNLEAQTLTQNARLDSLREAVDDIKDIVEDIKNK